MCVCYWIKTNRHNTNKIYEHQVADKYERIHNINTPKLQVHTDSELVNDCWLTIQWKIGTMSLLVNTEQLIELVNLVACAQL